jgi:hypothetical protein
MQKAIFKSQLLRANSQPELKAMASALEPLLNLCSMENTYRGGGGGFEAITSIVLAPTALRRALRAQGTIYS